MFRCSIVPFLSSLGPAIRSLDLRHVCQTMLIILASHRDVLATYEHLSALKMDITEGVWDWDGRGSPQRGATQDYVFPSLRLPALRRFELIVADLTISKPRAGPLDLVDCSLLSELSLEVQQWSALIPFHTCFIYVAADVNPILQHRFLVQCGYPPIRGAGARELFRADAP